MDLQAFLRLLHVTSGPSASGEYVCRCPAHDDRTASLCVREGENRDGKPCLFVKCQAGCATQEVLRAMGLTMRDLYTDSDSKKPGSVKPAVHTAKQPKNKPLGKLTTVYDYTDEEGVLLFQVCRYEHTNEDGTSKTFRARVYRPEHPKANREGHVYQLLDVRADVLYRLPEVKQAIDAGRPVFLVEGEKDADNMALLDFTATTNRGGASKDGKAKWKPALTEQLTGANVYILPDNDEPGLNDRLQVAAALTPVCKSVRLLDLTIACPELPPKGDITDFFHLLGKEAGIAALEKLMAQTQPFKADAGSTSAERDAAVEHYRNISGYCVEDGCICQWNDESPKRLATFVALPRAVITRDDGVNIEKMMVIDGWAKDGGPLPQVRVAAKHFKGMGWVLENWEFRANVMPGNTTMDKLRYVIMEVGGRTATRSTEYTHTGWRKMGGKWTYLYQGGAIGCEHVSVDLGSGLQAYRLDGDGTRDFAQIPLLEALEASYMLTTCMQAHIAIPLLGMAYLAPLREALTEIGHTPAFSTFLVGKSGSGKSVAAALALSHFGNFTAKSLPASFHDTSNYIQKKAFLLKDMMIVVDDYHPSTSMQERRRMESSAQNLSRAFGDNAPRNRMNSDTSLREATPPRCLSLITGEDMPDIGPSGLARYYVINVEKEDIPKDDMLTFMQERAQSGYFQRAMRGYIEWLLPQMDALPGLLAERFKVLRSRAQREIAGHARTPEAVAHLMLGYEMMTLYMKEAGMMDEGAMESERAKAWRVLGEHSSKQMDEASEENPGKVFIATLSELLTAKRAVVRDLTDATDGTINPAGMVGYMDALYYYLLPDITYTMIAKHTRERGQEFPLSLRRLYREMRTDGLLEIDPTANKATRLKKVDGKPLRLLWIPRHLIDGPKVANEQQRMDIAGTDGFVEVHDMTPFNGEG